MQFLKSLNKLKKVYKLVVSIMIFHYNISMGDNRMAKVLNTKAGGGRLPQGL